MVSQNKWKQLEQCLVPEYPDLIGINLATMVYVEKYNHTNQQIQAFEEQEMAKQAEVLQRPEQINKLVSDFLKKYENEMSDNFYNYLLARKFENSHFLGEFKKLLLEGRDKANSERIEAYFELYKKYSEPYQELRKQLTPKIVELNSLNAKWENQAGFLKIANGRFNQIKKEIKNKEKDMQPLYKDLKLNGEKCMEYIDQLRNFVRQPKQNTPALAPGASLGRLEEVSVTIPESTLARSVSSEDTLESQWIRL